MKERNEKPLNAARVKAGLNSVKWRMLPATLSRVPVAGLTTSMERLRLQGSKSSAVRIGRTMIRQVPGSGKAHRYLVRALLTHPVTPDDLIEARETAEIMVRLWDDPSVSEQYMDVLITQHRMGIESPDLASSFITFATSFPQRRVASMRRLLNYLVDAGDIELLESTILAMVESLSRHDYRSLAHQMLLRAGLTEQAIDLERQIIASREGDAQLPAILASTRLMAEGSPSLAIDRLESLPPRRSAEYSTALIEAFTACGRYGEVIDYLEHTIHGLTAATETWHLFDARWVCGEIDEAVSVLLELAAAGDHRSGTVARLASAAAVSTDAALALSLIDLDTRAGQLGQRIDDRWQLLFELDRIDDVLRVCADPATGWQRGPRGTYVLAKALYVRRRFDEALAEIDKLSGTTRHWEGAKLRGRILLEWGKFDEALADRAANKRPSEGLDEVEFFARLQLRRFDEAFVLYVAPSDHRRLTASFGDRAETVPEAQTDHRFVISMNGPGDEIQAASTFGVLTTLSASLTVTCDPRLESLLSRSFPNIRFLPVTRMSSRRHAGFLGPAEESRSPDQLFDLLTESAAQAARSCSSVVFSRSLPILTTIHPASFPVEAYLQPREDLRLGMVERFADVERPVGVTWRSEFVDAMRSIHYLGVEALDALLPNDATFVCLQYDATDAERAHLLAAFGERMLFLDDLDLRNDFETMAATVAACDAVVGVGTTLVELAGAVGTRSIMLQPNRFGSWREQSGHADYWYASMRVASATDPAHPESAVRAARLLLDSA